MLESLGVYDLAIRVRGLSVKSKNNFCVCYRSDISRYEQRITLAHELGHIKLGHFSDTGILGYHSDGLLNESQENEANAFVLNFLAPPCIMRKSHIYTHKQIEKNALLDPRLCDNIRINIRRNGKLTLQEIRLCNQFKGFVHQKLQADILKYTGIAAASILLIAGLFIWLQPFSSTENMTPTASAIPETYQVMVTPSGEKYHKPGCIYVRDKANTQELSMQEAERLNYEPCDVCFPEQEK